MKLAEFAKLKGDELLMYTGARGNSEEEKWIFKIHKIHKDVKTIRCTITEFRSLSEEQLKRLEAIDGTVTGGEIIIERIDGSDFPTGEYYSLHGFKVEKTVKRRRVDYKRLKVIIPSEKGV